MRHSIWQHCKLNHVSDINQPKISKSPEHRNGKTRQRSTILNLHGKLSSSLSCAASSQSPARSHTMGRLQDHAIGVTSVLPVLAWQGYQSTSVFGEECKSQIKIGYICQWANGQSALWGNNIDIRWGPKGSTGLQVWRPTRKNNLLWEPKKASGSPGPVSGVETTFNNKEWGMEKTTLKLCLQCSGNSWIITCREDTQPGRFDDIGRDIDRANNSLTVKNTLT